MTRRKDKKLREYSATSRKARIAKLIAVGWIKSAEEIPPEAIPVDPDRINLGGSYFHPTFFRAIEFTCKDCGKLQTWQAKDQQWYYETTRAPYYSTAVRCRECRQEQQRRKNAAGFSAGYAKQIPAAKATSKPKSTTAALS